METARLSGTRRGAEKAVRLRCDGGRPGSVRRARIDRVRDLVARDAYPTPAMIDITVNRIVAELALCDADGDGCGDRELRGAGRGGERYVGRDTGVVRPPCTTQSADLQH